MIGVQTLCTLLRLLSSLVEKCLQKRSPRCCTTVSMVFQALDRGRQCLTRHTETPTTPSLIIGR